MRFKTRNIAIAASAAAVLAISATVFFVTRGGKADDPMTPAKDKTVKPVDDSQYNSIANNLQKNYTSTSNFDRFSYKVSGKEYNEAIADLKALDGKLYEQFPIYEGTGDKAGKYYVMNGVEPVELTKKDGKYIVAAEGYNNSVSLIAKDGQRVVIFNSEEDLNKYAKSISDQADALTKDKKKILLVNGTTVAEQPNSIDVDLKDTTETFYDLEAVLKAVNDNVQELSEFNSSYADFTYELGEEDGLYTITRTAYDADESTDTVTANSAVFKVEIGEKGEVFYKEAIEDNNDKSIGLYGSPFVENDKVYVSSQYLFDILGINVVAEGTGSVAGTDTKLTGMMINTSLNSTPEMIVSDGGVKIKESESKPSKKPDSKDNRTPEEHEKDIKDNDNKSDVVDDDPVTPVETPDVDLPDGYHQGSDGNFYQDSPQGPATDSNGKIDPSKDTQAQGRPKFTTDLGGDFSKIPVDYGAIEAMSYRPGDPYSVYCPDIYDWRVYEQYGILIDRKYTCGGVDSTTAAEYWAKVIGDRLSLPLYNVANHVECEGAGSEIPSENEWNKWINGRKAEDIPLSEIASHYKWLNYDYDQGEEIWNIWNCYVCGAFGDL